MLFVGDDWAEDHHDVELQDEAGRRLAASRPPEGVEGLARLHALIARHTDEDLEPGRVAVGIETDRGPWVQALIAAGYRLYAVNTRQAASAKARKNYAGTSPITRASGRTRTVQAGWIRNYRLADALQRQAFCALQSSPGARRYYDKQRAGKLDQNPALRNSAPPRRHPPRLPQNPHSLRRGHRLGPPHQPRPSLTPQRHGMSPTISGSRSRVESPSPAPAAIGYLRHPQSRGGGLGVPKTKPNPVDNSPHPPSHPP